MESTKWEEELDLNSEEYEALSLCDLPVVNSNQEMIENRSSEPEDFDFGGPGGTILLESEMCAADDVFFQGQILPLRLSISSENGLVLKEIQEPNKCSSRSRSESISSSSDVFTSRSSSCRSVHSSATTATSTTTTTTSGGSGGGWGGGSNITTKYIPKARNPFHSHPSPKPQVWVSGPRQGSQSRTRKSTVWRLFRVGLVRTPELELQELKKKSFNSRSSSSNSSCSNGEKTKKKTTQRFVFVFEGCKCSADAAVAPISSKTAMARNRNKKGNEEKEKKEEKQALHQRRTVEWLKELSITDLPHDPAKENLTG